MRTLSLLLTLCTTALVGCNNAPKSKSQSESESEIEIEICDDGVDNDDDAFVDCDDPDCGTAIRCTPEVDCYDGLDNDDDGNADCSDPDCVSDPACIAEDCANDVDDDGDGAADCADSECSGEEVCSPLELWSFRGAGTFDSTTQTYTGTATMLDTVTYNPLGNYNIGDVLCEAQYVHNSAGPASDPCADCDWALSFGAAPLDTSFGGGTGYTGDLCAQWYDFTDPLASGSVYAGEFVYGDRLSQWGINSTYPDGQGGTLPVMMFLYVNRTGNYSGWYAFTTATWDGATGATTWSFDVNEEPY